MEGEEEKEKNGKPKSQKKSDRNATVKGKLPWRQGDNQ